jgi:hypothetical protein
MSDGGFVSMEADVDAGEGLAANVLVGVGLTFALALITAILVDAHAVITGLAPLITRLDPATQIFNT